MLLFLLFSSVTDFVLLTYNLTVSYVSTVRQLDSRLEYARFEKERCKQVTPVDWKAIKDENVRRQFKILSKLGTAALPELRLERVRSATQDRLERVRSAARGLPGEGEISGPRTAWRG